MQRDASCQIVGVGIVEGMKHMCQKLAQESGAPEPQMGLEGCVKGTELDFMDIVKEECKQGSGMCKVSLRGRFSVKQCATRVD